MTLPSSGSISFEMINTEIQRPSTAFLDMNDSVVRELAGIPSGAISINDLYSKSYVFERFINSTSTNVTLSSLFSVEEWTSNVPKRVTITSGVTVGSTVSSTPAISVGAALNGTLTLVNNGTVSGAGATSPGGTGGIAISCPVPIFIVNNGTIRSGGGAGGNGGNGGNGSYTERQPTSGQFYSTSYRFTSESHTSSGSGGSLISGGTSTNWRLIWNNSQIAYGSGSPPTSYTIGGWTYIRGTLQSSGSSDGDSWSYYGIYRQRTLSSTGGAGGTGGRGQGYNGNFAGGTGGSSGGTNAGDGGDGGTGGNWGLSGQAGQSGTNGNVSNGASGTSGGLGGYAITNYNASLHSNNGTIIGRL